MERLTQTSNSGGVAFTFDLDITCQPSETRKILNLATKLKEYEDLEEQGRLVKLPCKVGDTVYKVNKASKKVSQHKVIKFEIDKADATSYTMQIFFENFDFCFLHHFGETVFLTKSEAEQKLKEMESD